MYVCVPFFSNEICSILVLPFYPQMAVNLARGSPSRYRHAPCLFQTSWSWRMTQQRAVYLVSHRLPVLPAELAGLVMCLAWPLSGLVKVRWSMCHVHSPCRAMVKHRKACDTPVTTHGAGRCCISALGLSGPGPGPPCGGRRRRSGVCPVRGSGGAGAPLLRLNLERGR